MDFSIHAVEPQLFGTACLYEHMTQRLRMEWLATPPSLYVADDTNIDNNYNELHSVIILTSV